jgi:hypothetical protein
MAEIALGKAQGEGSESAFYKGKLATADRRRRQSADGAGSGGGLGRLVGPLHSVVL